MVSPHDPWSFAVSLAGFLVVILQLRVEPRRRRREAAIAAYRETLELRQALREQLPPRNEEEALEKFVATAISQLRGKDGPKHLALQRYLNYWETIAASALRGVIDVTMLDVLAGHTINSLRHDYGAYIDAVQDQQPAAFVQLVFLSDEVLSFRPLGVRRAWLAFTRRLPGTRLY